MIFFSKFCFILKHFDILNVVTLHMQVLYTPSNSPGTCQVSILFNLQRILFFHAFALYIAFSVHFPHCCFDYTLQADVMFQNFPISIDFIFVHPYTLHTCFSVHSHSFFYLHSTSRCLVYTHQAYVRFQFFVIFKRFHFFIPTFSRYILVFNLQTVFFIYTLISFHFFILTLSTYVLVFTLPRSCLLYTLPADVRFQNL